MITIEVNNAKCKLRGETKFLLKIQKAFAVRHPGAFFIRKMGYADKSWDGKIKYVTDAYYFKTGLLPQVVKYIGEELQKDIEFIDHRPDFNVKPKAPKKVGKLTARPEQIEAINAIIKNKVNGLHFPFGTIDAATNFGKTMVMVGIYLAYKKKIPAVILLNDSDLFNQFKTELPELVGEEVGFIRGKKEQTWGNLTVIMVQTVSRNISMYKRQLQKFGMVLVDEADLGDSKTYKSILNVCYNANIRVGLSGTIYMSKLKKDLVKNQNLHAFFGDAVYKITKREMVDKGYSTDVVIRITPGNEKTLIEGPDWKQHYREGIIYNEDRILKVIGRAKYHIKLKHTPILVVGQFHDHIELMYNIFQQELGDKLKIMYVHGGVNRDTRNKILKDFKTGEIKILIASFIIKRGKNVPLAKVLINAAAGDSAETISQLWGRLERTHESKNKAYIEDFYDTGSKYLTRHSKHRVIYYKKEGFKVITKY